MSLTAEQRKTLEVEAARTVKSVLAHIRYAIAAVYGAGRSSNGDLDLMRQSFGAWSERDDDGTAMVERLRSGSRLIGINE